MKQIMVVEDSFSTKEVGVIVSGVNPKFDTLEPTDIKRLIGGKIKVVTTEDIAISESLVGEKCISIAMGAVEGIDHVECGSCVYAIE
jgi:hypothetical protein